MKTSFSRFLIAFAFGIGFFSFQSCKERSVTNTDLIPPVDNINTFELTTDSLLPFLEIREFDSVRTNEYDADIDPIVALGRIESDPFFGTTSAGLYTQFVPPVSNFTFPNPAEYTFDSASLILPYTGVSYGNVSDPANNKLSFKVYRVTETLLINDSGSYTFSDYSHDAIPIGSVTASLKHISDSFTLITDTLSKQLRIPLDKNYIYNQLVLADTHHLASAGNFASYFNGWYIESVSNMGATSQRLSYFNLIGDVSKNTGRVAFYFHNTKGEVKAFVFRYSAMLGAYINRIQRNRTTAPIHQVINKKCDSIIMEGLPGAYTKVVIPNLNKIPASVINQAKLTLYTTSTIPTNSFEVPQSHRMVLERKNAQGEWEPIKDALGAGNIASPGGFNFVDGLPKEVEIGGKKYFRYYLNFPRELQRAVLAGDSSLEMRLTIKSSYLAAYGIIAPGFYSGGDAKMQLSIIYTKL